MYINSFCSIGTAGILTPQSQISELSALQSAHTASKEPDYKELIPPMQLRRMSKPVRTGVAAVKLCMKSFRDFMPQSIHVGTAYGMLEDSETFLKKMMEQEEQLLNPTAFIQSTHNTVSGQIALSLGCMAHNMTFVHHAHSFESALLDAALFIEDLKEEDILAGAVEELTDTSYDVLKRFNVYDTTIAAGEGTTFFALSKEKKEESIACIKTFEMFTADDETALTIRLHQFIQANKLDFSGSDILIHSLKDNAVLSFFKNNKSYAPYSGKYATMAAFGVAYSCLYLKENRFDNCLILTGFGNYYSFILLSGI
jgi:3-oxoacyl-[acyl-carrier-protein] synthase II